MNQDTLNRVCGRVGEVLACDPAAIQPESRLIDDLGADSLDLVELMYLLEQEFDIVLDSDDMSLSGQLGMPEDEIHQEEILTEKALALLRKRFPHAQEILKEGATRKDLAALLTVAEVVQAIERKQKEKAA